MVGTSNQSDPEMAFEYISIIPPVNWERLKWSTGSQVGHRCSRWGWIPSDPFGLDSEFMMNNDSLIMNGSY
jgi:hypothetical protein